MIELNKQKSIELKQPNISEATAASYSDFVDLDGNEIIDVIENAPTTEVIVAAIAAHYLNTSHFETIGVDVLETWARKRQRSKLSDLDESDFHDAVANNEPRYLMANSEVEVAYVNAYKKSDNLT